MSSDSIEQYLKDAVHEIAKGEGIKDYEIIVKAQEFTGDNYAGEMTRIEVKPSDGKESLHLIVKKAMTSQELRLVMPLVTYYKNETFAYTSVMPAVKKTLLKNGIALSDVINFAEFYKAITEDLKEAIIMKDMCRYGYTLYDKKKPFSLQQAEAVVKTVAMLHAASFVMKEKDPELYNKLSEDIPKKMNYGDDLTQIPKIFTTHVSHIECLKTREKIKAFGDEVGERLVNVLDAEATEPYNVICHGDCWNNNMLFKFEEEKVVDVVLIDWQIVRIASPATDLCYMMFMSMDAEYVEEHSEDLFELYYSTLREYLSIMGLDANHCYPKEIFHQHIKRSMIFGFMMAVCALPMIFVNPDEAQKVETFVNETANEGNYSVPMSVFAKKRFNNVVNYFVKHEYV